MGKSKSKLSLSLLTKSNVWALDENELYQLLMEGKHEVGYSENEARYMNIIRPVFDLQQLNRDDAKKVSALEAQHYQIFHSPNDGDNNAIAIRKRPIKRITDLTLEKSFIDDIGNENLGEINKVYAIFKNKDNQYFLSSAVPMFFNESDDR